MKFWIWQLSRIKLIKSCCSPAAKGSLLSGGIHGA
jgi:hypothetical protein